MRKIRTQRKNELKISTPSTLLSKPHDILRALTSPTEACRPVLERKKNVFFGNIRRGRETALSEVSAGSVPFRADRLFFT
jgi:hypothetical protein